MHVNLTFYPALNAILNGSSAVLIGSGLYLIKRGRRQAHKRVMIAAFATSTLFLISYLYYHLVLRAGITHFQGQGLSRPLYFTILIFAYHPGRSGCAVHPRHSGSCAEGQFRTAQSHRAVHLCNLDVRFGDGCCYLPDAI